jgi:uncharacterized RDD family membrane protein YckC
MYPNLFRRSVATLIDLVIVIVVVALILQSSALADLQWLKIALAIAIPLLYEPVLSAYACTVGQALMWTRVRDTETLQRIPLRRAYVRFAMKYLATVVGAGGASSAPGIPTAVSAFPGGGHRSLHDLQAGTVVVHAGSA